MAVFLLRLLPTYASSPLVRTRDPEQLAKCHTVVDVGGEYNPSKNRYDHHQRSFIETFPNRPTRLSSAGLVYLHFGKAIIAQHMQRTVEDPNVNLLHDKMYVDFIEALDASDNGISLYDPDALAKAGVEKRFRNSNDHIGSIVGSFNDEDILAPDAGSGPKLEEDVLFGKASAFIGALFMSHLRYYVSTWLPALTAVQEAYNARHTTHESGRILVFTNPKTPWKQHLLEIEERNGAAADPSRHTWYVLYPDSEAPEAAWRIQCVPDSVGSFVSRKPLPAAWRGVRDSDLDGVIAGDVEANGGEKVPSGAVFAHASGFIGGHKTKEGAMAMAIRSLNQQ